MQQVPLIETDDQLPSPVFRPRPGWGGKLNKWLRKHGFSSLVRAACIVAVLLIIRSLIPHHSPEVVQSTPTPSPTMDTHHQVAGPREGIQTLAARAIDECLSKHPELGTLDPIEHLWAVYQLARTVPPHTLRVGETVEFTHEVVVGIISRSQHLSSFTRASLLPYLKK